jgi:hypothetical protein
MELGTILKIGFPNVRGPRPMLKITPQSLVQFNPLDGPPEFDLLDLPSRWTAEWVSRRFVEGLKTLRLIPMKGAPRGFANAWPAYAYEFEDLIGQAEQREALEQTQREQNQVRLHPSLSASDYVRGGSHGRFISLIASRFC